MQGLTNKQRDRLWSISDALENIGCDSIEPTAAEVLAELLRIEDEYLLPFITEVRERADAQAAKVATNHA